MILSDRFIDLVHMPLSSLWAANCNGQLVPDLVRLMGVKVEPDKEHITFYVPLGLGENLLKNFATTDKLSFLMANVETCESYQLKGSYLSQRPCSVAEISYQQAYFQGFCPALEKQGFPREMTYKAYFHQPTVAVRMLVKEVYEQTPKVGTGGQLPSI